MEAEHKAKLDAEAKAHQEAAAAMEKMHQEQELAKAAEDQRKAKEMEVRFMLYARSSVILIP